MFKLSKALIMGIWCVLALACLAGMIGYSIVSYSMFMYEKQDAEKYLAYDEITGIVVDVEQDIVRRSKRFHKVDYDIEILYEYNDTTRRFTEWGTDKHSVGDKVRLVINPMDVTDVHYDFSYPADYTMSVYLIEYLLPVFYLGVPMFLLFVRMVFKTKRIKHFI